jgi:hypothetical protein
MWEALEQTGWVVTLGSTGWLYNSVAVVHYLTMFWFIGSIAIVDLRIMGVAAKERNLAELGSQLLPWAWIGFTLSVIAGFLEFATAASDWAPDPVFHVKLAMIGVSVVFTILVQMGVKTWAQSPEIPSVAKVIALISLLLWIATIVTSSEIPALEGLG